MPGKEFLFISCIAFIFIAGCEERERNTIANSPALENDTTIKYAKRFSISYGKSVTAINLFGNRNNFDTTSVYILSSDTLGLKKEYKKAFIIKTPCKRIAALSSIYAAMFCELGVGENIAAIDNIDYVNNQIIVQKFKEGHLLELAKTPDLDLEQALALAPDILIMFGMGDDGTLANSKLKLSQLPVAVSVDHLEASPLARAEWIKFFGAFAGKRDLADSIFKTVEAKYIAIKNLCKDLKNKPTVFSETKFGAVWYMPGGKSYMSQILQDAGANYLWADNSDVGSLPLSFEQVYAKAKEADFWINLPLVKSKQDLISFETRYAEFKAYKTNQLYNNTKHTNKLGYSTYWETGMIHPERILSDLSQVFHPELINSTDFYYYEQLK